MRHVLAIAFLLGTLAVAAAGTHALRGREDGPGLLGFILAPVRVFDGTTCG